jgi:hypothetical protein
MWEYSLTHYGSAKVTVKNEGRFVMRVSLSIPPKESKQVLVGQTATWTIGVGDEVGVCASYTDDRLGSGGYWRTAFTPHIGDDIKLTVQDCPGWRFCSPSLTCIGYGNGLFVAFGYRTDSGLMTNEVYWSRDGTSGSWTASKNACFAVHIAFGNGRFVVPGAWTTDVVAGEWTPSDTGTGSYSCVAYGNDRFVVVGGGKAVWSPDATSGSWTQSTVPPGCSQDIAFGNGRFVAVGYQPGKVEEAMWSTNGSSWTETTVGQGELNHAAYGNGYFVATGPYNTLRSPDGTEGSWTESSSRGFDTIAFGNGLFLAASDGQIMSSPDGSPGSWIESRLNDSIPNRILGIVYGNGRFVAVGDGRLLSSPDASPGSWQEDCLYE